MKYPEIKVKLSGTDGNAMAIMSKVRKALSDGGVSKENTSQFMEEAMSGDYNNVMKTCMKWVNVA